MRHRLILAVVCSAGCVLTPREDQTSIASSVTATHGAEDSADSGTAGQSPVMVGSGTEAGSDSNTDRDSDSDSDDTGGMPKLDVGSADSGTGVTEVSEVFGHSNNTLYRMEPDTKAVEVVGRLEGCTASIIDIALNADSQMFGVAYDSLWTIDRGTGACTFIANGDYPTSLSFVPAGTVDPDVEAMVGFVDEQYIRIDPDTGDTTVLGTLSDGLSSSGDMVAVIDGGSWLTVVGPGCNMGDCIIEIDPADGTILQNYGSMPYTKVFGLAFWAGRAYGFSADGDLFEILFGDTTVATVAIDIPGAPGDLSFFGAGSTTSAPPAEG